MEQSYQRNFQLKQNMGIVHIHFHFQKHTEIAKIIKFAPVQVYNFHTNRFCRISYQNNFKHSERISL